MYMDINYLFFLQNIRNSLGGVFDSFFAFITQISVGVYILLIPLFIYWAIDKRKGLFIYCTYGLGNYFNALLKSTFCVYRPWIRDSRIKPLESVMSGATGYSFPSGHATNAGSTYLPLAYKYKKHKALVVMCMIMIVLTMFSRNFVGVHTLSDVLVGMLIGIVSLFIIIKVEKYIEDNPNKDIYVLIFATLMVIGILLYVSFIIASGVTIAHDNKNLKFNFATKIWAISTYMFFFYDFGLAFIDGLFHKKKRTNWKKIQHTGEITNKELQALKKRKKNG